MKSLVVESKSSVAAPPAGFPWTGEPFRIFFPLGVALSWAGVATWLLYAAGVAQTYSCLSHGLIQTQAFLPAFALGFLFTALPRRTRSAAPSAVEMVVPLILLPVIAIALLGRLWVVAEVGYVVVFTLLLVFASRRCIGVTGARRPPAAFVLLPVGLLAGIAGAILLVVAMSGHGDGVLASLGGLFVEQGVFLCFTMGAGGLVLPLVGGFPPPADLGSSPRETLRAAAFGAAGVVVLASLTIEVLGHDRLGPLVRGLAVAGALAAGASAWRPPARPGFHRRMVWIGAWSIPIGLVLSAIWPDYRVPALHVTMIGGFSLLTFGVATHVSLGHLGMDAAAVGRPPAIVLLASCLLLGLAARVAADASQTYFAHLASAAVLWLVGTSAWLAFFAPRWWRVLPNDTGGLPPAA